MKPHLQAAGTLILSLIFGAAMLFLLVTAATWLFDQFGAKSVFKAAAITFYGGAALGIGYAYLLRHYKRKNH